MDEKCTWSPTRYVMDHVSQSTSVYVESIFDITLGDRDTLELTTLDLL